MKNWEKQIVKFVRKYHVWLLAVVVTLVSCYIRYLCRGFYSKDMTKFLLKWTEMLAGLGGFAGLKESIGNYNVPYLFILSLISYFPSEGMIRMYLIKMVSVGFEFICAVLCALIYREIKKDATAFETVLCYGLVFALPQQIINGALWGQCDGLYTAFILAGLLCMFKGKYGLAFFSYGWAFAFKLQFIFFLPAIIILYAVNQRFSITKAVWFVPAYFISILPGIIAGRDLMDIINIYFGQVGDSHKLTYNTPNLYTYLTGDYESVKTVGIWFAFLIFAVVALWLFNKGVEFTKEDTILLFVWSAFTCYMFLPAMHDRYNFAFVILSVVYAFFNRKFVWHSVLLNIITLFTYARFLQDDLVIVDYRILSAALFVIYAMYTTQLLCRKNCGEQCKSNKE